MFLFSFFVNCWCMYLYPKLYPELSVPLTRSFYNSFSLSHGNIMNPHKFWNIFCENISLRRGNFPVGKRKKAFVSWKRQRLCKHSAVPLFLTQKNAPTHQESINSLYANGYTRSDLLAVSADCSEMISQFPILTVSHQTTVLWKRKGVATCSHQRICVILFS